MQIYSILICISFISSSIEHIFNVITYFFSRELSSSFPGSSFGESFGIIWNMMFWCQSILQLF